MSEDALLRLAALEVLTFTGGRAPSVRTSDVYGRPPALLKIRAEALLQKTQAVVELAQLEPNQEFLPVEGLRTYIVTPRLDPPDVVRIVSSDDEPERFIVWDGHTRIGAAILRGESTFEVMLSAVKKKDGMFVPAEA